MISTDAILNLITMAKKRIYRAEDGESQAVDRVHFSEINSEEIY